MPETDRPYRRKLIEVSLPLNDISDESAREKSLRHGHPSTLHTWWARRPLAACRAIIFASLVDDPIDCPDEFPDEADQTAERERLHGIISDISRWENTDERQPAGAKLMNRARFEVARSLARSRADSPPTNPDEVLKYLSDHETGLTIYDPFCGGGSIPLEAQRLGLNAVGSDLNPISVLISQATIELPTLFHGNRPVNAIALHEITQESKGDSNIGGNWRGYAGLASDIRHYGLRVREEAFKRMGHFYPTATLSDGSEATVVAWLWANTIPCSNPVCGIEMPLIRNFQVSQRAGRPRWTTPRFDRERKSIWFEITESNSGIKFSQTVGRDGAVCLACETSTKLDYVRNQALDGNMRQQLIAIAAEGNQRREFLPPNEHHAQVALEAEPPRRPEGSLPKRARSISTQIYGLTEWHHLFTERQLNSLCTFSDVLKDILPEIINDGASPEYAKVVHTYLALAVGRLAHAGSRLSMWVNAGDFVAGVFGRQAIGMVWDFAESNPFCSKTQNWMAQIEWVAKVVERLPSNVSMGRAFQADAANAEYVANGPVIVTDPPYYDNIGYADISDFFYIWHNDMLRDAYPDLFVGRQTPKKDEIVAGPMFENPKEHFENLLGKVLDRVKSACSTDYPSSILYAYMQKSGGKKDSTPAGWETFLTAVSRAGLRIVGTWPVRTERKAKLNALKGNMLASSVVIVTRPRVDNAPIASLQQFVAELEVTLPAELDRLTREENIAPVDLAQAAIGPGMKIYTKYSSVETYAGEPVSVRDALIEINRVIGDYFLSEQVELDEHSRFCFDWLKEHGFDEGPFGDAEVLAKAKDVAIGTLVSQGLLEARHNEVRLLPINAFETPENAVKDIGPNTTSWEGLMRVAFHFQFPEEGRGVEGAAEIVREMGSRAGEVERLARIMFDHYDRKFQPANSRVYNHIADAWRDILEQAGFGRQLTSDLPV